MVTKISDYLKYTCKLQILKRLVLSVILFASFGFGLLAQSGDALDIVKKADDKSRGITSEGAMTMTIVRPTYTRSVSMKVWSKGTEFSLILVTAPAKEKGQVFLKRGNEMWNWLPSIERMVKIPPSMMMQSWMGSDFTNDDLAKQSSIVVDYTHKLIGTETIRNKPCYKIELTAKPDAPVVWGKIISWITKDGLDVWESNYYDEDGELINSESAYDIKQMGDRSIPTRFEIVPAGKNGQKTVLVFDAMIFNKSIGDDFFSIQNMKRIR